MWHGEEMEDCLVFQGVMLTVASPTALFDYHWEDLDG